METYIYGLLNEDGVVRYVGKSNSPEERIRAHVRNARNGVKTHLGSWIRSMLQNGIEPKLTILAKVPVAEWQKYERQYIRSYNNLVNHTDGGEGGGMIGKKRSDEWKRKMSTMMKGRKVTWTDKLSSSAKKRWEDLAYLDKMKESHIGRIGPMCSPEKAKKISTTQKGRALSDEHRRKLSEAALRRCQTKSGIDHILRIRKIPRR